MSCVGGSNGIVELIINGGTEPYIYENLYELSIGTYTSIVFDINGCEAAIEYTIEELELLTAEVENITNVSCFGLNDGGAILTVEGGIQPYTYTDPTVSYTHLTLPTNREV